MRKKLFHFSLVLIMTILPISAFGGIPIDLFSGSTVAIDNAYQPDSLLSGNTLLITFSGEVSGNYKIYYLEADTSKDFDDPQLTGTDVRLMEPLLVDTSPSGYTEGLYPSIFTFTNSGAEKIGIVFSGDGKPFFAVIDKTNKSIDSVTDLSQYLTGIATTWDLNSIEAVSDSNDRVHVLLSNHDSANSLDRIYYFSFPATDPSNIFVSNELDTTSNSAPPPHLDIDADSSGYAHLIWAAYEDPDGNGVPGWFVFYAMFNPTGNAGEEYVIEKTLIFGQEGLYFVLPSISAVSHSEIYASAQVYTGEQGGIFSSGELYLALLNPNLIPTGSAFPYAPNTPEEIFAIPPYPTGLVFLKPLILADTEHRIHVLGNGYDGTGITFASFEKSESEFTVAEPQKRVALSDNETFYPSNFSSDGSSLSYLTTGLAAVLFPGDDGAGSSHIFMTTTDAPAFPPQPEPESGCNVSGSNISIEKPYGTAGLILILLISFLLIKRTDTNKGSRLRR